MYLKIVAFIRRCTEQHKKISGNGNGNVVVMMIDST